MWTDQSNSAQELYIGLTRCILSGKDQLGCSRLDQGERRHVVARPLDFPIGKDGRDRGGEIGFWPDDKSGSLWNGLRIEMQSSFQVGRRMTELTAPANWQFCQYELLWQVI